MPDQPHLPPHAWQRWLMSALGVLVIVHSALVVLWLAPSSPLRDAVGGQFLRSYVDPYFTQSESAMDPGRQRVDEMLQVRARLDQGGEELAETDWIDLTATDQRLLRRDPSPARVQLASRRLATNLNAAYYGLSLDVRGLVGVDHSGASRAALVSALREAGASRRASTTMAAYDLMATTYASLYARAVWGADVVQVQLRVGRREVPMRVGSADPLDEVPYAVFDLGWRDVIAGTPGARAAFDDYVGK